MFDWNERYNPEPIPPPEPESLHEKMERVLQKHGKARCFWICYGVFAFILAGIMVGLFSRSDTDVTVPALMLIGVIALVFLLFGVAQFFYPKAFWELKHMFVVSGGEPTDFAIFYHKVGGVITVICSYVIAIIGSFL